MSDANNTRFSVVEEVTAGTTPTNPAWQVLRTLGSELQPQNQVILSREIRSSRNPPGAKLGAPGSGGRVPFELSFDSTGAFWKLLKASIQTDAETAATTQVTSVDSATTPNHLLASGVGTGIEVGDVVQILSSADALLGYRRVTAVSANDVTYEGADIDTANVKVKRGIRIKNGSTAKSFSVQEANYAPNTSTYNLFEIFRGQGVDTFDLTVALGAITQGAFGIVGPGSAGLTTSDPSNGTPTYTAAPTNEVQDSLNNVPSLQVAATEYPIQSITVRWQNGAKARGVVGQRTPTGIGSGQFRGSGEVRAYYSDIAEYNKALAGTKSSILLVSRDSTGLAYVISLPAIRWGNPTRTGKVQDEQIVTSLPFELETNATENIGVRILAYP